VRLGANIKGVKGVLGMLGIKEHRAITKSATNTAGNKTFSGARRAIKKEYNIKARLGEMPFKKIKATAQNLTYKIEAPTRMQNIGVLFKGAKQTSQGVRVQIKKGNKTVIKGAFIARPSGKNYKDRGQKRTVTTEKDLILQRKGRGAYPLQGAGDKAPKGIGWATMILNANVKGAMRKIFEKEFDAAFSNRLRKVVERKASR
jgi:hypothetical protein